jgi:hypothetical protein
MMPEPEIQIRRNCRRPEPYWDSIAYGWYCRDCNVRLTDGATGPTEKDDWKHKSVIEWRPVSEVIAEALRNK